ncbi:flagellar biosynthesis protein FlgG [Bacillus thuringiensis]|uniref:flagellar biosynthesis protein FlgG n=1 Tax=Bacillus thuringiensis TaxID=1428 RepID=UPI000D656FD7|nr:flagellar biosynthesis protein FlgG [Bacillus thuringiensis]MBD8077308.1 flagellar biosynthesis protein FlgG [Bacillus thuringiensis]
MNEKIYKEFVSSIYDLGDLKISEEEFQKKQEQFNYWLISLKKERRQQVIEQIMPIIIKVAEHIQEKQQAFKDIISVNEGIMKANSQYDKY